MKIRLKQTVPGFMNSQPMLRLKLSVLFQGRNEYVYFTTNRCS